MSLKASSKTAGPTPTKRRNSTLWSETLDVHQKSTFSTKEIKRQEVVHPRAVSLGCLASSATGIVNIPSDSISGHL